MKDKAVKIIGFIVFLIGFAVIYKAADFCVSDDTTSLTRIVYHDFYESDPIDILIAGSSHAVRGVNAVSMSEQLDQNVYNISTAGQDMVESYYVIREALENKEIDKIIFDISVSRFVLRRPDEVSVYIITDYMKSLKNRAAIILSSVDRSSYLHGFFRLRRNLDPLELPTLSSVRELVEVKSGDDYRNYVGSKRYLGHGQFSYVDDVFTDGAVAINLDSNSIDVLDIEKVKDHQVEYLRKIVDLCKERGVELSFMIAPYAEYYFMYFDQYDAFTKIVTDMAKENGIEVIDLNLVKKEYLDIPMSEYCNLDHINYGGSCMVSDFLVKYLRDPSQDYFYDRVSEKFPAREGVQAAGYHITYVTDQGEYQVEKNIKGDVQSLRIDISAVGYEDIPCRAELVKINGESGQEEVIPGKTLDEFTTGFEFPADGSLNDYIIRLFDPKTGEQIYEAKTKFNMT